MADETPEFNLADILNNVKQAQSTVTLYLDAEAAHRAVSLREALDKWEAEGDKTPRSIADKTPREEFQEQLEALDANALRITVRALSNYENLAIRDKIIADAVKADPKAANLTREKILGDRDLEFQVHCLTNAIIGVTFTGNGAKKSSLSYDEVKDLNVHLPEIEWMKLCVCYFETQAQGAEVDSTMKDPTFRRLGAGE